MQTKPSKPRAPKATKAPAPVAPVALAADKPDTFAGLLPTAANRAALALLANQAPAPVKAPSYSGPAPLLGTAPAAAPAPVAGLILPHAAPAAAPKPQPQAPASDSVNVASVPAAAPDAPQLDRAMLRRSARALLDTFDRNRVSVPIKPLAIFKQYIADGFNVRAGLNPSKRQAGALCVAAVAAGVRFNVADGSAPITFPRRFIADNERGEPTDYAVENGCTGDCIGSGLASYDSATETFTVSAKQARAIRGQLGALAAPAFA